MKKISVIIPVYNGAQYISRCIDSVVSQKNFLLGDLEIITINDGSKDESIQILRQYEERYPGSIRVIDQPNRGVARTRNKGIQNASAPYVMFIDQDDFIDEDYCRTFYDAIESGPFDVVVGGYKRPDETGKITRVVSQPNTPYSVRYRISAAWAKIHRTSFIRDHDIKFFDSNYGEDMVFTISQNCHTDAISGINYIGYNWFWNTKSVSNTSQRGIQGHIRVNDLMEALCRYARTDIDKYYVIQTGVHYLLFSGRSASYIAFMELYREIFQIYKLNGLAPTKNKYVPFGPSGAQLRVKVAVGGFILLHRLHLIGVFARIYCKAK